MLEITAQGSDPLQRLRQDIHTDGRLLLGRSIDADVPVPWDLKISRRHAWLGLMGDCLHVVRHEKAGNPIFVAGNPSDDFTVRDGERFAIGDTTFQVRVLLQSSDDRSLIEQATFDPASLRDIRFDNADRRIEVLTRLPEVILGTTSSEELYSRLIDLVLTGIPRADAVAIVSGERPDEVVVLRQDRRRTLEGQLRPSTRLISEALKLHRSVFHAWDSSATDGRFTVAPEFNWAFCTPLPLANNDNAGLYVTGRLDMSSLLPQSVTRMAVSAVQADVKFAELVADILRSVLRLNSLERQTAGLRQFLAPPILNALGDDFDAKLLEPRECDATVLFCDLKGFSAKAEGASNDLLGLLERVSEALGVMTQAILKHGGVTGDFLGDAALGFWGWPFSSKEAPLDACCAALAISQVFIEAAKKPDHPLRDFKVGIGIAHGPAVAGKIGTAEQVKFTVFGPVVNLASRLEGMTKQLRVPILIDETTAAIVREDLPRMQGRIRRLARVLPYGSERPLTVSELLPPLEMRPELTDDDLANYESAVTAFSDGNWDEAYRRLHRLPPEDRAPDFLNQLITAHNRIPPAGWDGIVKLSSK